MLLEPLKSMKYTITEHEFVLLEEQLPGVEVPRVLIEDAVAHTIVSDSRYEVH